MPRASIFGGNWWDDDNAGSRRANVGYNWPDNSNDNIGSRGRCDDGMPNNARRRSRSRRPATRIMVCGQPACPASANTLRGPAKRGVGRQHDSLSFRDPRPAILAPGTMAKRYRNLIDSITADETMREAYRLTARGKRLTGGYLDFKEFSILNLAQLANEMRAGTYRQGTAHQFHVYDPKRRLISALPFRDRIAQQALCLVIGPIFDKAMLPRAFACRTGKGAHAGVRALQSDLRRLTREDPRLYFLKTDFAAYFASIERATLWRLIEAKISCAATLRLLEAMIPRSGIGLPIGNLTSQIFANYYAGATLDRHLQQTLGERCWYRYMDDLVVLGRSSEHLRRLKEEIETFSRRHLGLRFSKWSIAPVGRGVNFLGYRIWPDHKLLRRDSVVRARRKIARYRAEGDDERLARFVDSWLGHARFADSRNLIRSLEIHRVQA